MGVQQLAAAAAAAISVSSPCLAQELREPAPSATFYIGIPLDARSAREQAPIFGIVFQGARPYETVRLDSRMLSLLPLGGVEAKWILAGTIALGASVVIARKDKDLEERMDAQRGQQQKEPCPRVC